MGGRGGGGRGGGPHSDEAKMCGERTKEQVQANQVQDKNKQAGGFPLALYLSCHVILEEHKAAETEEFEEYRRRCYLETEHQACHA